MKKSIIFLGAFAYSLAANAQTWTQLGGGSFDWNSDSNWSASPFPDATGANANLSVDITGATTINLNEQITVGSVSLNDSGSTGDTAFSIAPGTAGSFVFEVSAGSASITSNGATNGISAPIAFNSATNITVSSGLNLSGNLSGSAIVTRSSPNGANLSISGDNSAFTGSWVLSAGHQNAITTFNSDAAIGAVPSSAAVSIRNTAANSNLQFNFNGTVHANRTIQLDATTHIGGTGAQTITIDGKITGTGGLNKSGNNSSVIVLANTANDFSGAVNINAGSLSVAFFSALGASSSVNFGNGGSTGGGTLIYTGTGATVSKALRLNSAPASGSTSTGRLQNNGTGALVLSDTGSVVTASAVGTRVFSLGGSNTGDNKFHGLINASGTGAVLLEKRDGGTWFLVNEDSSYTGPTRIYGGILDVTSIKNGGVNSSIGAATATAGSLMITTGGTLRYSGAGDSTDRLFQVGEAANGQAGTINSSGSGALNFTNAGNVGYGTTNQTRTFNLSGTNTGNNTLAASITNNGTSAVTVNKSGAGKWILTGSNTYTGATGLTDGTLVVDGSLGNTTVTVGTGAFLAGSGSIAGAVTVSAGGTVAPGNSPGQLDTGNFTLSAASSTLSLELGSTYDQLNVTGTVNLGSGNLQLTIGSGLAVNDLLFGILNDAGENITGVFGRLNGVTTTLTQGSTFTLGGYEFGISYVADSAGGTFLSGNDMALQVIAVPEPASVMLIAAGAGMMLVRRRRVARPS